MKLYNVKGLSRALGIGEGEIRAWTRRGIIKKGVASNGLYDLEKTAQEIIAMLRGPEARELVPGIWAVTSLTTVPIKAHNDSSSMEKVKSDGTGGATGTKP